MGISHYAHLEYGIMYSSGVDEDEETIYFLHDEEYDDNENDDWEEIYCENKGLDLNDVRTVEWYNKKFRILDNSKVEVDYCADGECDESDVVVTIKDIGFSSDWCGEYIDINKIVLSEEQKKEYDVLLKDFCKTLNIKYKEPGWILYYTYG